MQPDLPAQIHQWDQESPLHMVQQRTPVQVLYGVMTLQLSPFIPDPRAALHTSKSPRAHPHTPQNKGPDANT